VAQREYNAFFLILSVFFLFDFIGDSIAENNWQMDAGKWTWFGVFIAGFLIFAVLRGLKKHTKLLNVEGR
jgi:hypothetical protein